MKLVPAGRDAIAAGAQRLRDGGLVAFPTETVYGLGADARNGKAVARIFEVKGRPSFNPLIVHVASTEEAALHGAMDPRALRAGVAFWPGPLTLVLRRRVHTPVSELVSAGLDTVALRVPAHPVAAALLKAAGVPVAAPSANPSGHLSPTRARHVVDALGAADVLVIDGGPCPVGLESTVLDLSEPGRATILRHGAVTRAEIEAALGCTVDEAGPDSNVRAPGMLARHYAPAHPLRLGATSVGPDEALLGFGGTLPAGAAITCNLSPAGDLREAAANLFAMLHELDNAGVAAIAVMPIPEEGLGAAINDRLRRAAAGR